ncbi:MAG: diacylglycerol kinase family lipid kinase [Deltaproteobacteria bacterium]|nr:diacylglycerol kinase family lipid kinase [Deltaproteobacteria bacterium]
MDYKKTVVILNPSSGNGETGREWPNIYAKAQTYLGSFESLMTTKPGEATMLTRQSLQNGADRIICIGGDGTLNEVINGFVNDEHPINKDAVLGFVPNGTGCDFVRTVPIPRGIDNSLDMIVNGVARTIDLGRVEYLDKYDNTSVRYFHNIASFGLGGEVVDRVNRTSKALGPFICFLWSTLISLFLFGKKKIRYKIDDGEEQQATCWNIAVANGQYHGGGMQVAPDALVNDGLFHITVIGDINLIQVFWHLPKLYTGKINTIKQVTITTGKSVSAWSDQRVLIDMDGEQPGYLPAKIDIVPAALKMIMGRD